MCVEGRVCAKPLHCACSQHTAPCCPMLPAPASLPHHTGCPALPPSPHPHPRPQVPITLNAAFCERHRKVCPPSDELERECGKVRRRHGTEGACRWGLPPPGCTPPAPCRPMPLHVGIPAAGGGADERVRRNDCPGHRQPARPLLRPGCAALGAASPRRRLACCTGAARSLPGPTACRRASLRPAPC